MRRHLRFALVASYLGWRHPLGVGTCNLRVATLLLPRPDVRVSSAWLYVTYRRGRATGGLPRYRTAVYCSSDDPLGSCMQFMWKGCALRRKRMAGLSYTCTGPLAYPPLAWVALPGGSASSYGAPLSSSTWGRLSALARPFVWSRKQHQAHVEGRAGQAQRPKPGACFMLRRRCGDQGSGSTSTAGDCTCVCIGLAGHVANANIFRLDMHSNRAAEVLAVEFPYPTWFSNEASARPPPWGSRALHQRKCAEATPTLWRWLPFLCAHRKSNRHIISHLLMCPPCTT